MIDKEVDEFLKKVRSGSIVERSPVDSSVGKDLQLISKELTDDRNVHRFSNIKKIDVPISAMLMTICESGKKPLGERGRYYVARQFAFYQSLFKQAVDSGMADRYKDQSGYLLAFRGGIEWRQAGIMGDMQNMDEQKQSLMQRMKR